MGVFRFSHPPLELQEEILKHTDLIPPAPLQWDQGWVVFEPGFSYYPFSKTCYTSTTHVADSSLFSRWHYPEAFSQVSSAFRELACRIFYSKSIFRVEVSFSRDATDCHPLGYKNAFVRAFPRSSLQHLRHVHWTFDRLDSDLLSEPGQQDEFVAALRLIKDSILASRQTLSKLTIAVDFMLIPHWAQDGNAQRLNEKIQSCQALVDLIRPMKDIRDFFVYHLLGFCQDCERLMGKNPEIRLERRLKRGNYDSTMRKIPRERICWNG